MGGAGIIIESNMFYTILIILYFLAFGFLAWKNLQWGIYVLVFGLPSYLIRFNLGPLPMTVLEGMILILFFVFIVKKITGWRIKKDIKYSILNIKYFLRDTPCFSIILFLFAGSMAVMVAPETRVAMGLWKAYFIEPILFFMVLISVLKKEDLKNIFWALAGSSLVVSVVAIYQKITGNLIANDFWASEVTRRVSGVYPYPNALALYIAPIIILLIGFVSYLMGSRTRINDDGSQKTEIRKQKLEIKILNIKYYLRIILLALVIILGLSAIYWSGSKGALMGIGAGIFFYALFWTGKRKYFWPVVIVGMVLVGWLWQSGRINLKGNYSVEGGDSVSVRQDRWSESWQMIQDHYLLGAGLGGYQEMMKNYHPKKYIEIYLYPHNIFLNFWSETGVLGLLAFLMIVVWFYKRAFIKQNDDLKIMLAAVMMVIIVHGLVDVPYFKNDLSVFFWLLLGMMWIIGAGQKGLRRL